MIEMDMPLYTFVDDHAMRSPNNRALSDEQRAYSYRQLSELSDHYAFLLSNAADIKSKHIGMLYDYTAQSIVLMLAIMKAGGVYIPLNRTFPEERITQLIQKSSISLVIAPDQSGVDVKHEILSLPYLEHVQELHPFVPIKKPALAYAIFTSGSTGLPKLALLSHAAVSRVMRPLTERYHIQQVDKVLQFANLSFDASISEIFGAFIAGAELIVPSEQTRHSITKLATYIHEHRISIAILPPSLLAHMPLNYDSLKTIVVAGESCPSSLAKSMSQKVPHFINAYGPTECAICVSTYEVPKNFDADITPIGTPLPGVSVSLRDENHIVIKNGDVGELYVSGPTLFSGYYADDEKTKSVTVQENGQSFYKTGDYAYEKEGELIYVSRKDDYIKRNGIRISPLEIEEIIQRSDVSIKSVAIIVMDDEDKSIVAFYSADQELPQDDLFAFAKQHLPVYALPSKIVHRQELPLNDNQKIDRNALQSQAKSLLKNITPADKTSFMQNTWQAILHTDITNTTDFFYSGGDSLKAMRLLALIDAQYNTRLDLSDLFNFPTFSAFTNHIKTSTNQSSHKETYDQTKLTPYETMIWSASAHAGNPATYTLTELIEPDFSVDTHQLQTTVTALSDIFTASKYRYLLGSDGLEKQSSKNGIAFTDHGEQTRDEAETFANHLANTPINVEAGPLIHIHHALTKDGSIIIIHAHHILLSASMIGQFIETLWQQYNDTSLPQPADETMDRFTESDSLFWEQSYESSVEYVQLPWIDIRQPKPNNKGHTLTIQLDEEVDTLVTTFTKKHGITKFVFYRSLFALLLHRLSSQNTIYIGSSVDIRSDLTLGSQPAMLNTLPIISSLQNVETFMDLLRKTQKSVRDALDHRFMPLHDIIKLHPFAKDRLIGPFNIMFDYIDRPSSYKIADLGIIKSHQIFNETSKYDLTVTVAQTSTASEIQWEYDTDLISEQTIQQFATIFSQLTTHALADANFKLKSASLFNDSETIRMLAVGKGERRLRSQRPFYEQFVDIARGQPSATAIKHNSHNTSYRDLHYLVDHYSAILIDQQLSPETPVGIFMNRSVEMIAIIISLWRLGYAYVPIETNFPEDRITSILDTTRMPLILTRSDLRTKLPTNIEARVIDETYTPITEIIPEVNITQETLAYIIFTSGSTGKPKGVMIEHGGMMNHAEGMIEHLKLGPDSTIAQTASHSFDISVWQLTTILITGGSIAIYSKDDQAALDGFTTKLRGDNVTILELVPSYITALLEYIEETNTQNRLAGVRALISTGENISQGIIDSWFHNAPGGILMNAYGPAEASDDTNLYTFETSSRQQRGLPVGTPLPNVDVYVFDEMLRPQPTGVQGEIYISGIAVGRGYINDPERTEKVFVTNPHDGARMYKTGDLGYWTPDGQLIYTGRSDFQVKLRGFRIELEEIEAHIARYPRVSAVAVVVSEKNSTKQLHAYITSDAQIDSTAVLNYLRTTLPEYMIPSAIIQLSALPLNNSGKIDRTLLANKERLRFKESEVVASLTTEEIAVMDVWREIFKVETISLSDDYYALGGDSIASFRVYAKLVAKGYHLALQDILAQPILKDFAKAISVSKKDLSSIAVKPDKPVPLTPIQERFINLTNGVIAQNIHIKGQWEPNRLNEAIQFVAKKQGAFFLTFAKNTQTFGTTPRFNESYAFIEQDIDTSDAFARLSVGLEEGALFAYGAKGNTNKVSTLFLSANHLVVDIVSWNSIVSAITDAYAGVRTEGPIDYSFGAWTQALGELDNPSLETLQHWQTILDQSAQTQQALQTRFVAGIPSQQLFTTSLKHPASLSKLTETHVYTSVLAALAQTLSLESAGILVETHGRYGETLGIDISQTTGWFTHILPVAGVNKAAVAKIITTDDVLKLSYGIASQRKLLDTSMESLIIVNYLGKRGKSEYNLVHGSHELPIGSELIECTIFEENETVHIELILYATPKENGFIEALLRSISVALKATSPPEQNIDDKRLQSILKRIGGIS